MTSVSVHRASVRGVVLVGPFSGMFGRNSEGTGQASVAKRPGASHKTVSRAGPARFPETKPNQPPAKYCNPDRPVCRKHRKKNLKELRSSRSVMSVISCRSDLQCIEKERFKALFCPERNIYKKNLIMMAIFVKKYSKTWTKKKGCILFVSLQWNALLVETAATLWRKNTFCSRKIRKFLKVLPIYAMFGYINFNLPLDPKSDWLLYLNPWLKRLAASNISTACCSSYFCRERQPCI